MPKNTLADIQIISLCLMRILSVALKLLLSKESCVLAFVLKVLNISSLFSTPLIKSFFAFLDNSLTVPLGVLTNFLAEQADKNKSNIKPVIVLLLIHICFFLYFLMKFFIAFCIWKLHSLFPKI